MQAKIRAFARYADGSPWPGATLQLSVRSSLPADPPQRPQTRPVQVIIAEARGDHQGYAVIDLGRLPPTTRGLLITTLQALVKLGSGEIVLSIAEDPTAHAPVLALDELVGLASQVSLQGQAELIVAAALDTCRAVNVVSALGPMETPESGTAGLVERPDSCDYRLSPASFVVRSVARAGDAQGCEHLMPSAYPVRTRTLRRTVVRNPQRPKPPEGRTYESADAFLTAIVPGTDRGVVSDDDELGPDATPRFAEVHEFEQRWFGLGHSLGEIKYSLALAPGEAVRMAVIDWSRTDEISRDDSTRYLEDLRHRQSREREIDDIIDGRLREDQGGGSFQAGLAGGAKATVPVKGVPVEIDARTALGGAVSHSWGERDLRAREQQDLQEEILQRSSLFRAQTSTVVIQATQAERNVLATRIVANMNRMHALTISYYEVLRHFLITTEWKRTQHALLVPVSLISFDDTTARRFRPALEDALLDPSLSPAFEALDRLNGGAGLYAKLAAEAAAANGQAASTSGSPGDGTQLPTLVTQTATFRIELWSGPGNNRDTWGEVRVVLRVAGQNDGIELLALGPKPADNLDVSVGTFWHEKPSGNAKLKGGQIDQPSENKDGKTLSYYRYRNQALVLPTPVDVNRVEEVEVEFKRYAGNLPFARENDAFDLDRLILEAVFPGTQPRLMLVNKAWKRTEGTATFPKGFDGKQSEPVTARVTRAAKDEPPSPQAGESKGSGGNKPVQLPPTEASDKALVAMLLAHLNANRFHYGMLAWAGMPSSERRRRVGAALGIIAEGLGDEVLGIVGFSIVLPWDGPVPPWVPSLGSTQPPPPTEDIVTLPTRGVFAEAHLGRCNGAEQRDVTRLWNFAELPVSLLPNIEGLTPGPRGQAPNVAPAALPQPVVTIVNPPAAPAPTGLGPALVTLQTPGIFRDMSGLKEVSDLLGKLIEAGADPKKELIDAKQKIDKEIGKGQPDAGKPPPTPPNEMPLSPPPLVPAPDTPTPPKTPQEEWDEWKVTKETGEKPTPKVPPVRLKRMDVRLRVFTPSRLWALRDAVPNLLLDDLLSDVLTIGPAGTALQRLLRFDGEAAGWGADASAPGMVRAQVLFSLHPTTLATTGLQASARLAKRRLWLLPQTQQTTSAGAVPLYNTPPNWAWEPRSGAVPLLTGFEPPAELKQDVFTIDALRDAETIVKLRLKSSHKYYFPFSAKDVVGQVPDIGISKINTKFVKDLLLMVEDLSLPDLWLDLDLVLSRTAKGELRYRLQGSHSAFPAFEVTMNGQPILRHLPGTADPQMSLLPGGRVDVDSGLRPLPG
ncbi:hypothetical protein HZ992_12320 [Rhizobacter sp. AJA081-3]|uniref:hypothetical protein n=1 Tax=Rhizobacter sp. AJA081-3 TaxID=2753607 RepID=UPI001AE067DC|nr:hypothetical protein [Rhizobacter sp. AJA081-3]QTN25684.1 hypothetical protein HZ992_12320 [Rhizobacter sp. AJA081-3]